MLAKLAARIVEWQISKGILALEKGALYRYAYEILLNQAVNLLLALLIAAGFHTPLTVFLFLACYIPLRSFCGGYHARTNWGCTVISAGTLIAVCHVERLLLKSRMIRWYPLAFVISGIFIIKYAPVPDENKPLDNVETMRYRTESRLLWGIETLIGAIIYLSGKWEYGSVIAISHITLTLMLILGHIPRKNINS